MILWSRRQCRGVAQPGSAFLVLAPTGPQTPHQVRDAIEIQVSYARITESLGLVDNLKALQEMLMLLRVGDSRQWMVDWIRLELYSLLHRSGEFMNDGIVVTALDARANFGKLLRRVEDEGRSLVIEKRGRPRAVLLSIRDYVRLAVPEPEVLRIIGQESKQKGTNRIGAKQIDQVINAARKSRRR